MYQSRYYNLIIILAVFACALSGCATQTPYFKLVPSLQSDIRQFDGTSYLPLIRICDTYGFKYEWDGFAKKATIRKGGDAFVMLAGSDRILVNGSPKRMDGKAVLSGGALFVPVGFVRNELKPSVVMPELPPLPEPERPARVTIRTIVLDPGHGGRDVGALGRKLGLREKNVALSLAKKVRTVLEASGIRVIMTRSDDTFIPLPRRAQMANRAAADLFVSIHINASRTKSMKGFECYYLSTATDDNARALQARENGSLKLGEDAEAERSGQLDKTLWDMKLYENRIESAELAGYICDSVDESLTIGNKGVRSARFYVLKYTHMPAVLVEAGYISNRYEETKLKESQFLDRVADAVAQGILRYKREYERTEGFSKK